MEKRTIVEFGLSTMSMDYKREFLYKLDSMLKEIHESGGFVTSFDPNTIYITEDTRMPVFSSIRRFLPDEEDQQNIKVANLLWMADLAFCLYLPDYNLANGLLNPEVISMYFQDFKGYFPEEDVDYYASIFQLDYSLSVLPTQYYSDYINTKMEANQASAYSSHKSYSKSTLAGRMMSEKNNIRNAGYANYILMTSLVGSLLLLGVWFLFSFSSIFS